MKEHTIRALAAINRRFYREHARAFSETRRSPWPGWELLLPRLRALPDDDPVLRVLDVGCGNGRFGRFLADAFPRALLRIDGVDASAPLLAEARAGAPAGARFHTLDLVFESERLPAGPFDLVTLFGVIHGIPGRARRRALLLACARRVAAGGLLVFTTWRFAEDPRLASRRLDEAHPDLPLDPCDLEPGDGLLPWGASGTALRYVHAFRDDELDELAREIPLRCESRYRADGRSRELNEYLVFRAAEDPSPRPVATPPP